MSGCNKQLSYSFTSRCFSNERFSVRTIGGYPEGYCELSPLITYQAPPKNVLLLTYFISLKNNHPYPYIFKRYPFMDRMIINYCISRTRNRRHGSRQLCIRLCTWYIPIMTWSFFYSDRNRPSFSY